MTVQNPSACFSMSTFGPLQKFTRALASSGALMRISTRPVLSTRGYSAPHTLVSAGLKSLGCCAEQIAATDSSANANPNCFIVYTSYAGGRRETGRKGYVRTGFRARAQASELDGTSPIARVARVLERPP